MRIRPLLALMVAAFGAATIHAEETTIQLLSSDDNSGSNSSVVVKDKNILNHLDLGVTLGTTGIGIDAAMPLGDYVKVRAGFTYVPKFTVPFHFDLMSYTADGSAVSQSTFNSAKSMLDNLAGFEVNQRVSINGKANMYMFKLLFDIYPFKTNKHWNVTAGFYIGNKKIGTAVNDIVEAPTLVAVGIYNGLYDYVTTTDFMDEPIYDTYYLDPDAADLLKEKFESYGRMGIHAGYFSHDIYDDEGNLVHAKGDPYLMEPGSDGTVRAKAIVNAFRPYLGIGYNTTLDKAKRLSFSVEAGALFWGGSPKIITHEGVDLLNDVENVGGRLNDYLELFDALTVYPVLNFRISYAIF